MHTYVINYILAHKIIALEHSISLCLYFLQYNFRGSKYPNDMNIARQQLSSLLIAVVLLALRFFLKTHSYNLPIWQMYRVGTYVDF
jgi:uncharacterized membrane-anchored protein